MLISYNFFLNFLISRSKYLRSLYIYKILNNMLSARNKIERVGSESQRQTRQTGNIVLGLRKTRNVQKNIFYEGVKMYSFLPLGIKQCDRLKTFKRELKEHILNAIRYFFVILVDSIIISFPCVLHSLHFVLIFYSVTFCSLYFVFYILYLKIAEKAESLFIRSLFESVEKYPTNNRAMLATGFFCFHVNDTGLVFPSQTLSCFADMRV